MQQSRWYHGRADAHAVFAGRFAVRTGEPASCAPYGTRTRRTCAAAQPLPCARKAAAGWRVRYEWAIVRSGHDCSAQGRLCLQLARDGALCRSRAERAGPKCDRGRRCVARRHGPHRCHCGRTLPRHATRRCGRRSRTRAVRRDSRRRDATRCACVVASGLCSAERVGVGRAPALCA